MDFFDRHKALIITILLFTVILLAMYNIHLYNNNQEISQMLVQLDDFKTEEEAQEQEPEEVKIEPENPSPIVETHQAFNTNQQENEAEFQERLDEIFEENSAKKEAAEEGEKSSEGKISIPVNKDKEYQERSDGDNSSEETSAKRGNIRNSSISFSLLGRKAVDIPNPIYTCDTPGRIVVNIVVNEEGNVIETSINEASSNSTNECLTNQALRYAADALFTNLPGRHAQKGTITYNFQE